MTTNYFRAIAHYSAEKLSVIIDSNGMFDTAQEFSAHLTSKGLKLVETADGGQFLDVNIKRAEPSRDKLFLRACKKGWPDEIAYELDGVTYRAYKVDDKIYIPNKNKTIPQEANKNAVENKPLQAQAQAQANKNTGNVYEQYCKVKAKNPNAIVFYRVGDFYEVFGADAETASTMLGLTLTSRDCGTGERTSGVDRTGGVDRIHMCGVPFHSIDNSTAKLTDWGFKVVIAEPQ